MQRSPRTIRRWCDDLGIKLTASRAGCRSTPTSGATDEGEEILDELEYLQEQILLRDKQIAELQNQIASYKGVLERQKRDLHEASLQEIQKAKENKAAADEAIKRVKEQTSSAKQRLDWEMANMNKVAELQRSLAAAKAKTQSQPHSLLDDLVKLVTIVNALEEWINAPSPSRISYQPKNAEEYKEMIDIEYRCSGRQARDEMIKSVISSLEDYLFQRFGAGLRRENLG